MYDKLDALNEVDQDTLAKIALATVAGLATGVGAKHLYKKYREKQLEKKYLGSQEDKKLKDTDPYINAAIEALDANTFRHLSDIKK